MISLWDQQLLVLTDPLYFRKRHLGKVLLFQNLTTTSNTKLSKDFVRSVESTEFV